MTNARTKSPGKCNFCGKPELETDSGLCEHCMSMYCELRDSQIGDLRIEVNQAISHYQL